MTLEPLVYILPLALLLLFPLFRQEYFATNLKEKPKKVRIQDRLEFFDLIRGIAILGVILIHVTYFFQLPGAIDHPEQITNAINNVFRFAIPIFLITSGVLLNPEDLQDSQSLWNFYWRKFWRIFLPYLVIGIFLASSLNVGLSEQIYLILSGNLLLPYYFLIVLGQLYLLYPILVRLSTKPLFLETCLLISVISNLVPELAVYEGFPIFNRFLFFFAYGIKLRNYFLNPEQNQSNKIWWWVLIANYLVVSLVINEHLYNMRYFYGLSVFNLFFIFQKRLFELKSTWLKPAMDWLIFLGKQSLIVYLTHFLFIQLFFVYFLNEMEWAQLFAVTSFSTMICSTLIAWFWDIGQKAQKQVLSRPSGN